MAIGCGQTNDHPKQSASELPTPPGGVIAHVGTYRIDAQAFKSAFVRAIDAEPASTRVMPIPPNFQSCVEELEAIAKRLNLTAPARPRLKAKCSARYEQVRGAVMTSLIEGLWVVGEAQALGLGVRPATARDPTGSGLQAESKRLAELVGQQISEAVERLSAAQLKLYYEEHHEVFAVPHRRDLKIVRVAREPAAKRIKREIEMGRTFASAAKGLPRQPTFGMNAFVAHYEEKEFREPVLSKAIFAAKPHRVEGPLFVSPLYGYFVFEVVRDYPQHQRPFASVERKVVSELPSKLHRERVASFVQRWASEWRAKTTCTSGYVVSMCKQAQTTGPQIVGQVASLFG